MGKEGKNEGVVEEEVMWEEESTERKWGSAQEGASMRKGVSTQAEDRRNREVGGVVQEEGVGLRESRKGIEEWRQRSEAPVAGFQGRGGEVGCRTVSEVMMLMTKQRAGFVGAKAVWLVCRRVCVCGVGVCRSSRVCECLQDCRGEVCGVRKTGPRGDKAIKRQR